MPPKALPVARLQADPHASAAMWSRIRSLHNSPPLRSDTFEKLGLDKVERSRRWDRLGRPGCRLS